ncbi:hypothetical protein MUP77_16900 [Candidatus Bathyarchaeota archaeon]|nr:hypothetical protein [Candidatus Bathyarchaeota archaeon]
MDRRRQFQSPSVKVLIAVAVFLVIATAIGSFSQSEKVASPRSVIYDNKFTDALYGIQALIPPDDIVVTSTNAPFVQYFTGHTAKVPFGASSLESLLQYMVGRQYRYLLVFEGSSQIPELHTLFSSSGLAILRSEFTELVSLQTDFSKIHLYTR